MLVYRQDMNASRTVRFFHPDLNSKPNIYINFRDLNISLIAQMLGSKKDLQFLQKKKKKKTFTFSCLALIVSILNKAPNSHFN